MSFLDIYNRLLKLPFGKFIFNKGVGFVAPFFGKISPDVVELNSSRCVVRMRDRRGVRNHIGTINAGAMCTLVELVGGMAVDASIPADLRWIPKGMTILYLTKAKGTLEAVCELGEEKYVPGEIMVPVTISNQAGKDVCFAQITFYISKKKT